MFHKENLRAALMRRVYPRTALHRKVLAHDIGRHVDTIDRIMAGEGAASFEVAGDLARYFHARGDNSFAHEAFGLEPPRVSHVHAVKEKVAELQRMLEMVPA